MAKGTKKRLGDELEEFIIKEFPNIFTGIGFQVVRIWKPERIQDDTDVHIFKFVYKDGGHKEEFIWAIECKDKVDNSGRTVVNDNELLYKIPCIETDLPIVETWLVFAPEKAIKDKSQRIILARNEKELRQFYVEVWDKNNVGEYEKVFKDKKYKSLFSTNVIYTNEEVRDYILEIARKGKKRHEEYERYIYNYSQKRQQFESDYSKPPSKPESSLAKATKKEQYVNVHIFLDRLNYLLDKEFSIVKKVLFSGVWKLGIAYVKHSSDQLMYTLYPITFDSNDNQIKEVSPEEFSQIAKQNGSYNLHSENPIEKLPLAYASEVIQSYIEKLIDSKALDNTGSPLLAEEFIIAFIDKFHHQLGLEVKNAYTLSEVRNGFQVFLPLWILEVLNLYKEKKLDNMFSRYFSEHGYFDPDLLLSTVPTSEREGIIQRVKIKIASHESTPTIPIGNDKLPFLIFSQLLNYLEQKNITVVNRMYILPDFKRMHELNSSSIWDAYSDKNLLKNTEIFYKNLPSAYETFITNNFPLLNTEFSLYKNVNKILVIPKLDYDRQKQHSPTYIVFYLKSNDSFASPSLDVVNGKRYAHLYNFDWINSRVLTYKGKKYEIIGISHSVFDFILEPTPLLTFIYKLLKERIEKYFRS